MKVVVAVTCKKTKASFLPLFRRSQEQLSAQILGAPERNSFQLKC